MILALETGWTPDKLAELPRDFRDGCHWVLYGRAIAGDEGFPVTTIPKGAPIEVRLQAQMQAAEVSRHRDILFPEDA